MESGTSPARKVMVVADPSRESAGALQYALSHVVVENDELILLHVENPNSWRNTFSFLRKSSFPSSSKFLDEHIFSLEGSGGINFLEAMKHICELAQPKIRIRMERMHMEAKAKDNKDKANAILGTSMMLGVDLIIIGQRRSLSSALLGYKRSGSSGMKGLDTAEYLIENSKCTCVGVQKKGQNGGYLLNTKTQKNFWLLA
ncbi:uncharacterized protein LOC8265713 [Ricinus communis]|uniref:UspA domain-containing protein n=1 Tax=Ricinus communis TaxID=3988 RepID=B9SQR7_RICCO|nr:uncharacterized protein LOC8265713 [Ricinus communis]EEF34008.1 conserved hypothetical protein [Ricinus communis]|eukprot:XP_002528336.1 uncharacterized protein LOC8265713 [Ricinus communis]